MGVGVWYHPPCDTGDCGVVPDEIKFLNQSYLMSEHLNREVYVIGKPLYPC